jgi:hypothetical protein
MKLKTKINLIQFIFASQKSTNNRLKPLKNNLQKKIKMSLCTYRPAEAKGQDEVGLRSGGVRESKGVVPKGRTVRGAEWAGPRWRHVALILFETNAEVCAALEMAHISMPLALLTTAAVSILELATMIYHGQHLQFEVARTEHALKHTIRSHMSHDGLLTQEKELLQNTANWQTRDAADIILYYVFMRAFWFLCKIPLWRFWMVNNVGFISWIPW